MAKRAVKAPADLTYEQALQELEGVVRQLEAGEGSLEEALALFERGQLLAARCSKLLGVAELKLQELTAEGDGSVRAVDLEEEG
ncbi:MAG: exodeoxyribonuclease VII small subunit [Chloroflexi bacterium]|jgi:exodeoxyribonuclease VII small subunit|nr:exodeoxyribonuclease VII small subunit [Chloroflexota bacterium]